jgi:hypothetical protein
MCSVDGEMIESCHSNVPRILNGRRTPARHKENVNKVCGAGGGTSIFELLVFFAQLMSSKRDCQKKPQLDGLEILFKST